MLKNLRVLFIVLILVSFFAGTASALEVIFKDVTIIDDGVLTKYSTTANTLEEFFENEDIKIYEKDLISKDPDFKLPNASEVAISRAFYLDVDIDGKIEKIKVEKGSAVGNLISTVEQNTGLEYIYTDGYYADELSKGQVVVLKSKRVEITSELQPIPFETEVVLDDKLELDKENITQQGVLGTREIKTKTIYLGAVEDTKMVMSDTVTVEPVKQITTKGTYVKPKPEVKKEIVNEEFDFNYKKVLTMNATAYTAGYESTGKRPGDRGYGITASGMKAQHGVVAVDPRVIPLGTKLYIEGYGYSVAGDTGGAIKGNKIDLFYDSLSAANNFGRRNITVYILE